MVVPSLISNALLLEEAAAKKDPAAFFKGFSGWNSAQLQGNRANLKQRQVL